MSVHHPGTHLEERLARLADAVAELREELYADPTADRADVIRAELRELTDAQAYTLAAYDRASEAQLAAAPKTLRRNADGSITTITADLMGGCRSVVTAQGDAAHAALAAEADRRAAIDEAVRSAAFSVWGCPPCPVVIRYYGDERRSGQGNVYAVSAERAARADDGAPLGDAVGRPFLVAEALGDPATVTVRRRSDGPIDWVRAALSAEGMPVGPIDPRSWSYEGGYNGEPLTYTVRVGGIVRHVRVNAATHAARVVA